MQLREWQEQLQQSILHPQRNDAAMHAQLAAGSVDKKIQLEIYSHAYVSRLAEALRTNYPAVHQLLGDDDFDAMAKQYLEQYPSQHTSIRWFGNSLATFFKTQDPYRQVAVFAELARFEWALRHTIDAADVEVLTFEMMQAIAPEAWGDLYFSLHPSVTVMTLQWNTPQLWSALVEEQEMPERVEQAMSWMVYRQTDLVSIWRSVSELELAALDCLQQGQSFADICEVLNSAQDAAGLLRTWIEQGLLSFRTLI